MLKPGSLALFILLSSSVFAAEEALDPEFLAWLGQMAEVEELGVDVTELLQAVEQQASEKPITEQSDEEGEK